MQQHGRMRSIASTVLLALLVAAVAVPSGLAQGGTVIRLPASPGQIDVGGTTTVTLQLENVSTLYGAEITITTSERNDVKIEKKTNKRGKATIMVPDVTYRYDVTIQQRR